MKGKWEMEQGKVQTTQRGSNATLTGRPSERPLSLAGKGEKLARPGKARQKGQRGLEGEKLLP